MAKDSLPLQAVSKSGPYSVNFYQNCHSKENCPKEMSICITAIVSKVKKWWRAISSTILQNSACFFFKYRLKELAGAVEVVQTFVIALLQLLKKVMFICEDW